MNIALSVDWDFFFEEHPLWDWGHKESKIFIEDLWTLRLLNNPKLLDEFVPKGYDTFWENLVKLDIYKPLGLYVAESHCFAYLVYNFIVKHPDVIMHFDFHPDTVDLGSPPPFIDCQNWLLETMRKQPHLKVIWICPNFHKQFGTPELCPEIASRVYRYFASDLDKAVEFHGLRKGNVVLSYVARSGAWTPPWADDQFIEFVRLSEATLLDVPDHPLTNKKRIFHKPTPQQLKTREILRQRAMEVESK